ncbi:ribonuclease R [Candidatus Wolfebacteria bacterium]|nr:MAG: ribonuclease R [Candidatus Wolfebacteria bacterium]
MKKQKKADPPKPQSSGKKKQKPEIVEGMIRITSKGMGYVSVKDRKDDIEIDAPHLNTALHRDTVLVQLYPRQHRVSGRDNRKQTGKVIKIIKRVKLGFAGVLEKDDGTYYLSATDKKMYVDIIIPSSKLIHAKVGQKVFGVITKWTDPKKNPQGEITHILGMPHDNDAEMLGISLEMGFESTFPVTVQKEAEKILSQSKKEFLSPIEEKKRRDFRDVITFTIDPDDAKDFDDALSVQKLPDGNMEIGIHIADVSHYVRPNSILDKEAVKRGTSVYLVDRTIPMLPEEISNDLCSLRPEVDRLTFSAVFTLDKNANVVHEWFGKTIIHSKKRFSYEKAQEVLNQENGEDKYFEELTLLNTFAKKIKKQRFEKGAISLDQDEVQFVLDPKGVPIEVRKKVRTDTHRLVEEFMLLANKRVAMYLTPKNKKDIKVFVYRIHDKPDKKKVAELVLFLAKLGYKVNLVNGLIPQKDLNELLQQLEGKEEKGTIQTLIIRTMAKAIYSTKNIGHYGLAFKYYTHFTSPIRRYPDVMVHRLFHEYLQGNTIEKEKWHHYEMLANSSSEREREAQMAERDSIKYKQVEYMSTRIGKEFDGVITGLTRWGIYTEEAESKSEGMIKLSDIKDDYYSLDEKTLTVVGKKSKREFKFGDKIRIKVVKADIDKKIIDYTLA